MPTPTILIVEDDDNIAQLLAYMFRREGLAAELVADGRAAEAYVRDHEPPAAVLLDVMLPYRDGFAVAATIRSTPRWRDVPVVMLTARTLGADVERGRSLGVADYVTKPFQPRSVIGRVKDLVAVAVA